MRVSTSRSRSESRVSLRRDSVRSSRDDVLQEIRDTVPDGPGSYAYSNLGAATAGQAAAAATGMAYPDLMRTRLFEPLGMSDTAIQTTALVACGEATMGRPVQPWAMDGYAPAGAVISTTQDMSALALAVLHGTAPGLNAMTPTASTDSDNTRIGIFWQTTHWANGQTITWHNGGSGGYTAYLGFDLERHRAVVVLSDVAKSVDDIGVSPSPSIPVARYAGRFATTPFLILTISASMNTTGSNVWPAIRAIRRAVVGQC